MLTLDEQERAAYQAGERILATALGAQIDAEDALAAQATALEEQRDEIEHLKRIIADALADDCWRERATAALAD